MTDLEPGYWLRLTRNTALYYWRVRRPIAGARALWKTVIGRYNGELCQFCGRSYVVWMAADGVYQEIHGDAHGLICPSCFTARARDLGIRLIWQPWIRPGNREEKIMNTCQSCKYWTRGTVSFVMGTCGQIVAKADDAGPHIVASDDSAALMTPESFGCTSWEQS